MHPLIHLLAFGGMLSITLANNTTLHDQLFSRQSADCIPLFLEYPTDLFVPCGDLYISNLCACCPGDVLGCYISVNVCTVDSYGASLCCPEENPNCGIEAVSPATSAPPSSPTTTQVYESSPTTTAQDYPSPVATTPPLTTPMTTQGFPSSPISSSQSDANTNPFSGGGLSTSTSISTSTSTSAATSSVATGGSVRQPTNLWGQWEILAVLFLFQFI